MPVPIVPLALGAGLALWTLYEKQHAKEAQGGGPSASPATPVQVLPPVPLMPGAQVYLPPIAAPEPIRNLMANALFSKNPVTLRTTAQNLQALGYGELAAPLLKYADSLQQLPAVRGDWFEEPSPSPFVSPRRRDHVGDDFELLARTAGIGVGGVRARASGRTAALLEQLRRDAAVGEELDALVRTAGVGAWQGDAARHRLAALRGWAHRRAVAGLDPPSVPPPSGVFVGGHPYAHRRRSLRRILRHV